MVRTKEGGSVISFVVIAVILAALLVGGAFAIRRMTTQPTELPQAPQSSPATPQTSSPTAGSQGQPASPTPSTQATSGASQSPQTSPSPSQLPQTGPEGLFSAIVALGMLSATAVAYVRSRRLELLF